MTIDLDNTKISKLSGGACPQTTLVAGPFSTGQICLYTLKVVQSSRVNVILTTYYTQRLASLNKKYTIVS